VQPVHEVIVLEVAAEWADCSVCAACCTTTWMLDPRTEANDAMPIPQPFMGLCHSIWPVSGSRQYISVGRGDQSVSIQEECDISAFHLVVRPDDFARIAIQGHCLAIKTDEYQLFNNHGCFPLMMERHPIIPPGEAAVTRHAIPLLFRIYI